jgi:anti-anti-sigma regulatory factor
LHLANVQGTVAEALRITHLNRLFDIHDSVEAAIAAISQAEGQPDK